MRVRAYDLKNVRVESAIKRIRSDVAMHASPSAGDPGHVNGFGNTTSPSVQSKLDAGESLGAEFGTGSHGLSPKGGFQSEVEGDLESASQRASKTTSDVDVPRHAKENTVEAYGPIIATAAKKRVSSVMAMPSAFSSDSALPDTTTNLTTTTGSLGFAPPTPTPALAKLAPPSEHPEDVALPPSPAMGQVEAEEDNATTQGLPTPINSPQGTAKIPRSKSADPEKAARRFKNLQREASDSVDGDTSVAEVTDADIDAHSSTTDADADPTTKKSRGVKKAHRKPAKKVTVDDFDIMRVLGKGCAGKVQLVKYKKTGDLYSLKAITKRHVLAHQELQHTLTEQAVLKRMLRKSKHPVVVKLW